MKEVCQWETFEAKCQDDEVIIITEAHYGRLGVGRCQPRDFGFAGCSADVSAIMDARCSGRKYCSVAVPDPVMFAATPCPKDLVTYLQADYKCIKVAKSSTSNCDDQLLTAQSGDIAKPLTDNVCPHRILAQPGQTVNVYLSDFYNKDSNTATTSDCITYGYLSEGIKSPVKICGGEFKKNHLIYSSDSNVVDMALRSSNPHHYLLHYEVIGCPMLQAPPNAFVKIQDDAAVIMCNFSHVASTLVCSGNEWIGDMQNCTGVDSNLLMTGTLSATSFNDMFASVAAMLCVGLASGVLFIIGLLAFIRARHSQTKKISELPPSSLLEKPALPQNEKSFKPVDAYQPVYVPITMDGRGQYAPVHQNSVYEAPRPSVLSALHDARVNYAQFASTLDSRRAVVENTYSRPGDVISVPVRDCKYSIYDMNSIGKTRGRDLIITMEGTVLK